MAPLNREDGYSPDVARVWLLNPDGSPTGESRWDRKLRVDGQVETNGTSTQMWLTLADGERGLWPWIVTHLLRERAADYRAVVWPIAIEMWADNPERGWMNWQVPLVRPWEPISKIPDPDACPVVTWHGVRNSNWRDDRFRDAVLGFVTVGGRPSDAPPPLSADEAIFA